MVATEGSGVGGAVWPSATTRLAGVMGSNADRSLSPAIHNAAYRSMGADWVYLAFPVPPGAAGDAVAAMRVLQVAGMSVTIPHKVEVMRHLDRLTDTATVVGAVNTIYWDSGELIGENTDVAGLLEGLEVARGAPIAGQRVLILGAGGAARAAAWAVGTSGAQSVAILARRPEASVVMVTELQVAAGERGIAISELTAVESGEARDAAGEAGVVISATPEPDPGEELIDCQWLDGQAFVYDLVYRPSETALVRSARLAGLDAESGLGMLIAQAAIQVETWTGNSPSRATMEAAAVAALAE